MLYIFNNGEAGKKVLPGDLVKELGISFGRITNILKVLEKKGYVPKEQDCMDRRRVYVSLTEEGECYIKDKYQKALNYFSQIFEQLGEEDAAQYYRISLQIHKICQKQMQERQRKEKL